MPDPISVLLVDDSPVCLTILKRMLSDTPLVKVVGTATNGHEALELIPSLNPQVICTDLEMPVMDGLELTKEVMAQFPLPILVISNYVHKENQKNIFHLLEAGAVDVFPKPRGGDQSEYLLQSQSLIEKIHVLSGVVVIPRLASSPHARRPSRGIRSTRRRVSDIQAIVIGASTGGPQALLTILSRLPRKIAVPIVCVQHLTEGFLEGLAGWLDSHCPLTVCIAQDREIPRRGTVYFPQEGKHLELDGKGRFVHSIGARVQGHRPSVDVTFGSVAKHYGSATIGILLTGMGQDGVAGLKDIAQAGGCTIAQDEQSCFVFGMPKQAIEQGTVTHVLSPPEIAEHLKSFVAD